MRKFLLLMISVLGISVGQAGAEDAGSVAKFHNAVQSGDVNVVRTMQLTGLLLPMGTRQTNAACALGLELVYRSASRTG